MPFDPVWLLAQSQPAPAVQFIDNLARTPLSQVLIFAAVCTVIRLLVSPVLFRTPKHKRYGLYAAVKFINEACDALIYAGVIVFMVVRPFGVQTFFIPSESMRNTLLIGDFIVANKFVYRVSDPQPGDIIVFRPPARALNPGQGQTDFIKRLVGVPGQVVEIRNGELFRDGKKVDEPYVTRGLSAVDFKLVEFDGKYIPVITDRNSGAVNGFGMPIAPEFRVDDPMLAERLRELPAVAVPKGFFLAMGDNRNESFDSRGWGLAERRNLIGRSEFIWMPVNRWRGTR